MNEVMIDNWNKIVKDDDILYHLGDIFCCNMQNQENIMKRLNGKKYLRLGNHDTNTVTRYKRLGFIDAWKEDKSFNEGFIISHYPVVDTILPNVHGHVHSKIDHLDQNIYKCVAVELINYTPIHIDEIITWVKKSKLYQQDI